MNIFPLLIIGSEDKDRVFFNGGLAKIGDRLYCSARDGQRKYYGTDKIEVLSDAALFSLDIKGISDCNGGAEISLCLQSNNRVYKNKKNILYSSPEILERKGFLRPLPGRRKDTCREDHRFLYLGKDRWAFLSNTWKHDTVSEVKLEGQTISMINTATQIAAGNPENFFNDAKFYSPLIEAEKSYGTETGQWPYKSLVFSPVLQKNGKKVEITEKLAGRFRPMDKKGDYYSVEGFFHDNQFTFKSYGITEGMNYIGKGKDLHVSPSTNPVVLKIIDKGGFYHWFNCYMDHRRSMDGTYSGHFQITTEDHRKILYFEKEPSLKPLEIIEKRECIKNITGAKLRGLENVVVPYGLVSLKMSKNMLLVSHGVSDSFWQLSGLYAEELIEKIKKEIKKYGDKIADKALLKIFKEEIEEAEFLNYNDID